MDRRNTGPLSDIRVLDLADGMGLYCTKLLCGLGAEVIKVEPPEGDPSRRTGPFVEGGADPQESLYWLHYNTNKRSVTLDLSTSEGQDLFRRLSRIADVVVETAPPGGMDGLGVGWEALSRLNPRLIWAAITPFGQQGPWREYQSSDLVGTATGGLLSTCGWPGEAPEQLGGSQGHHMASVQAAVGILMALFQRTRTDRGTYIDVSMQASIPVNLMVSVPVYEKTGRVTLRGWDWQAYPANGIFPCKDGYIDFRLRIQRWDDFVRWLDEDNLGDALKGGQWSDPWYRQRPEQIRTIDEVFCTFLMNHGKKELYEEGQKRGFEIAPVHTLREVAENSQLKKRGYFVFLEHPELGRELPYLGPPFRSSASAWNMTRRAPSPGEDNEAIYGELGLSPAALAELKARGTI